MPRKLSSLVQRWITRRVRKGRSELIVEEDARVADEQSGVLEMSAVVGVRVQDELGVGKELLQDVGVDRRDHDVVAAVDDQDGKLQALEVGVAGILGGAVRRQRRALGGDGLVRDGRVAVGASDDPLDVCTSGVLTGLGRGEQDRQPHVFLRSYFLVNSSATQAGSAPIPSPPRGPVPTSTRAGSWSSRVPMKCWKNTSGGR